MPRLDLNISAVGLYSALAPTADASFAAMLCGYDAFDTSHYSTPSASEPQICAEVFLPGKVRGVKKHSIMAMGSLQDAVERYPSVKSDDTTPLILCLPAPERSHYDEDYVNSIYFSLKESYSAFEDETTILLREGRTGFATAIEYARDFIYQKGYPEACIIAIDSYVNREDIFRLSGEINGKGCRLLTDKQSKGFIPGEASATVFLSHPTKSKAVARITGLGLANEAVDLQSDEPLRAIGLTQAIKTAMQDAEVMPSDADIRLSSISGEVYFFEETAIAAQKTLRVLKPEYPLWSAADYLGELGAATGAVMCAYALNAARSGQLPGPRILCQLSSDRQKRAAFIIQLDKYS